MDLPDRRVVRWRTFDGVWWMLDGHDPHYSSLARNLEQVPFRSALFCCSVSSFQVSSPAETLRRELLASVLLRH